MMNLIQTVSAAVSDTVNSIRPPDKCPPKPVLSEYTDMPLEEIDNVRLLWVVALDLRSRVSKTKFFRKKLKEHYQKQLDDIMKRLLLLAAVMEEKFGEIKAEVQLCELIISHPETYAPDVVGEAEEDIVWLYEHLDRLNAVAPCPSKPPPKIYEDRWRVDWGFDSPY